MASAAEGYIILTLKFEREGNKWVGTCVELGTSTFARTLEQCEKELRELIVDHINVLEETRERERFFQKWGIEFHLEPTLAGPIVIRGSQEDWDRLLRSQTPEQGPFFQPSAFPIRDGWRLEPEQVGV